MGWLLDFFVPREHEFLRILEDAGENVSRSANTFSEFIKNYHKLSKQQKKEYLAKIEEIEHRGDRIVHFINDRLNNTFVTPIDKEDIHKLAGLLDDIIDLIYSTTKQIVLYDLKKVDSCILETSKIINEGVKEVRLLLDHLKKIKYPKTNGIKIHQLENEADELYQKAMALLYTKKRNPTEMIKLKDIYFDLELVTDKIEDISEVVQNIIIKHG
jgi:hypothetical protein